MLSNPISPPNQTQVAFDLLGIGNAFAQHVLDPVLRFGVNEIEILGRVAVNPGAAEAQVYARCDWRVKQSWRIRPPSVFCRAPWVKTSGADWHVNFNGTLCYVHPWEWNDFIRTVAPTLSFADLTTAVAGYAFNNLRWLLEHHLAGYRLNLRDWPPDWPQWSHRQDGELEYYREREQIIRRIQVRSLATV